VPTVESPYEQKLSMKREAINLDLRTDEEQLISAVKGQELLDKVPLMGVTMDNVTMTEALTIIEDFIRLKSNAYVVTPNVNHVVKVQHDNEFKEVYEQADLVLVDGMPLMWAARLLKKPLKEKVSGSDLFPVLCRLCEQKGYSVYLLGGTSEKIILDTVARMKADFPKLRIAGYESPDFGFETDEKESQRLASNIEKAAPDVLFVGVGAPKQEKWIYKYKMQYKAGVSLGIGAAFNFYLGYTKRAPVWMQHNGLEWFYRFLQEPRRLFHRCFIENSEFFKLLIKEFKSGRKSFL
jgi:N-acetylglucosaminyldiphosphoundecaprenol N-acetyl-beta-D-mannosaminyltransferase